MSLPPSAGSDVPSVSSLGSPQILAQGSSQNAMPRERRGGGHRSRCLSSTPGPTPSPVDPPLSHLLQQGGARGPLQAGHSLGHPLCTHQPALEAPLQPLRPLRPPSRVLDPQGLLPEVRAPRPVPGALGPATSHSPTPQEEPRSCAEALSVWGAVGGHALGARRVRWVLRVGSQVGSVPSKRRHQSLLSLLHVSCAHRRRRPQTPAAGLGLGPPASRRRGMKVWHLGFASSDSLQQPRGPGALLPGLHSGPPAGRLPLPIQLVLPVTIPGHLPQGRNQT